MTTIDLEAIVLERGAHKSPEDGMCVMELAAYLSPTSEFSDRPPCVSPAIGNFLRNWNDKLLDEPRQRLKPYALLVLNTNTTKENEEKRAWLATDWLVRTCTPAWLARAGLAADAQALRDLPKLNSTELAQQALPSVEGAQKRAAAAWDAAGAAAWDAAGDAAGDAAWVAARDAAGVVPTRAAAWDAADKALAPTVLELQESAFELLDRMIAVGKTEKPAAA